MTSAESRGLFPLCNPQHLAPSPEPSTARADGTDAPTDGHAVRPGVVNGVSTAMTMQEGSPGQRDGLRTQLDARREGWVWPGGREPLEGLEANESPSFPWVNCEALKPGSF